MKVLKFFLLVFVLFFSQSCDFIPYSYKATSPVFLRYHGNAKYKVLETPVFYLNERIFYQVPVFEFVIPDEMGYYYLSYWIEVLDSNSKIVYELDGKLEQMKISEFPSKDFLRFYYDTSRKTKIGKYTFRVNIYDYNSFDRNIWETDFELKRVKK